ncbi:N-acetylmuramoyl-L-alanine amidase [Streptomyces sp. DvalAA-14]|uniref:N-acetylmuramoyl-L-alanine amidase n=1 Tax=unclassified Streptomyces TaxID=2593676 RepID=UPI00081B3BF5|nr:MULTISPECIES: N-acetylmuramoyl-L-alanine amidase [unclassified Streptomyces]MYS23859.1 N-acetylmuramoyl-L-alanine amidase [Streptomyces sp. SID4948]SCE39596.1 N-acetylmuramoyl-L-alanine amidase [Streptomyces sp. DvalAA-14]
MHHPLRHPTRRRALTVAAALSLLAGLSVTAVSGTAGATDPSATRQAEFSAAAQEFGVPLPVLEAVSYNESRWEAHAGQENAQAGYGPMNLTDLTTAELDADGLTTQSPRYADLLKAPAEHTAAAAAGLLGTGTAAVTSDETQNIRGGAALLASYARGYGHGRLPRTVDGWYAAAARYSQATEDKVAQVFADEVWSTLRAGAARTTQDGQQITLAPLAGLHPDRGDVRKLGLTEVTPPQGTQKPECPKSLGCDFIPAAYTLLDPSNLADYGSHDLADRPNDLQIRYITLHSTDETYDGTLDLFRDPTYAAGAHYVVRSQDGQVTQLTPTKDIAWDSANRSFYQHSIGIEQEAWATHGATWFSEPLYRSTAALVKYLAAKYDIPLDRAHILGHDNVPGSSESGVATQHWDPGPGWDWEHFFDLLGAPIHATAKQGSDVVAIKPGFAANPQTTTYCDDVQGYKQFPGPYQSFDCPVTSADAPSSFVPLYTAPSTTAPLVADPYLHPTGAGTTAMNDWGDKAPTGEQYVVAARQPGWTAIWFGGRQAWFQDSARHPATVPVKAARIVPKPGRTSIPVYTTAYPESSVYPADFVAFEGGTAPRPQLARAKYTIPAGQSYVESGPAVNTDSYFAIYYDGSAPYDQHDFVGQTKVYEIVYNHRMAFVDAADVDVVPAG